MLKTPLVRCAPTSGAAPVVAAFCSLLLFPTPSDGETLSEALATAYQVNPTLMASRAELRQTDERAPQARAGWRPTVSLSASAGITHVDRETNGITTTDDSSYPKSLSASVSQPLYTFGRVDADVAAADATIEAQRASLFATEQQVLLDAATAYLTVIREAATLQLQENNLERLRQQLAATRARFASEDLTRTDVAQAEARVAEARADVTAARATLIQARTTYRTVIGQEPNALEVPDLPGTLPQSGDAAADDALRGNYTYLQARFTERAAELQLDSAEADLLPTVKLVTDLSRSADSSGTESDSTIASASVQISVPLYQAGAVYSQARQALENLRRQRFTAIQSGRSASEEAANAFEAYQSNLTQLDSLQARIDAAAIALEGVQQEASIGARTVLDVLDAEQDLLDARVRLVRSRHEALVSSFRLLSAVGRLTARDLDLPVEHYDYDRHYVDVRDRYYGLSTDGDAYFKD